MMYGFSVASLFAIERVLVLVPAALGVKSIFRVSFDKLLTVEGKLTMLNSVVFELVTPDILRVLSVPWLSIIILILLVAATVSKV